MPNKIVILSPRAFFPHKRRQVGTKNLLTLSREPDLCIVLNTNRCFALLSMTEGFSAPRCKGHGFLFCKISGFFIPLPR